MAKSTVKNFTLPKVKASGKQWYVWFRYLDFRTGKMKLIIKKGGANYLDLPAKERLAQLNALKKAIQFKLEVQGWNPITNTYPNKSNKEIQLEKLQNLGFNEALDFAHSKCIVASKTKLDYGTTVKFFKIAAEQLGLYSTPIIDIKRQHIRMLLEHVKTERKWSNHAYNKNLGYLGAVIDRLLEWEIIESNPAHNIKTLPVAETQKFEPLTKEEKVKLQEYLYVHNYRFFVFLMCIYHTGIRPKEVLSLRIKDINKDLSEITILPDLVSENSKTKKIRKVPVNLHLQPFIRELKLNDYPDDYFIFGSPFLPGLGNKGSTTNGRGATHPDYFKPSLTQIKRDTVTKLWKKIVKDHLKIDKYQYALKHTGSDDKILAGISLDALRDMYGHSSKYMTEKYARKIKEVYRDQIIEKSPSF